MALPEKATSPALSDFIMRKRSIISLFARSSLLGLISCASMLFEQSRAIMISTPFWVVFSHLYPHCGTDRATIAKAKAMMTRIAFIHLLLGSKPGTMEEIIFNPANPKRIFFCFRMPYTMIPNTGINPHNKFNRKGLANFIYGTLRNRVFVKIMYKRKRIKPRASKP